MGKGLDDRLEEATNFDLSRLTVVGWLLSLTTTALFIGLAIWFASTAMGPGGRISKGEAKLYGFGGLVVFAGFFVGCRWILESIGIRIVRPLPQKNEEPET
jgi:hypothetical protein